MAHSPEPGAGARVQPDAGARKRPHPGHARVPRWMQDRDVPEDAPGPDGGEAAEAAAGARPEGGGRRPWWQWFLLYPSLLVAVIGAVPTYFEAYRSHELGVPFGGSKDALEQNQLWEENFDCANHAVFTQITTKKAVEIGSVVCDSGDVLLRGKRPEWDRPKYRWVAGSDVAPSQATGLKVGLLDLLFPPAYASAPAAPVAGGPVQVLCQRWVAQGRLLQRVASGGACFDLIIDTRTGQVLSSAAVACNAGC
jgi:hypothetical protein